MLWDLLVLLKMMLTVLIGLNSAPRLAEASNLQFLIGSNPELYEAVLPFLFALAPASKITHAGPSGSGVAASVIIRFGDLFLSRLHLFDSRSGSSRITRFH
jgi:hypothetical protein